MPADDKSSSRDVAEQSREASWQGDSFLRDAFLGRFRLDLIESLALQPPGRPGFRTFFDQLEDFLRTEVDPQVIDETGEYPQPVIDGLAELGAFGMKIPEEYGGLGLTHPEYIQTMELLGSHDANVTALLSAHQAIGVPQPIKLFGTDEQKERFLPRCASGAISAFALTEPAVGSDPARLATRAVPSDDGKYFTLHGKKLWCTNGTLAEIIVVMARDPEADRISAFVVEMDSPGVTVEHRCRFMGLRALANALISFDGVRVPRENLIGSEGDGLKIALTTLNTGRLSLPAATSGVAKHCMEIVRKWSAAREQWGQPIGKHEAVAHMNADIAASTYAMDTMALVIGELADRDDLDIRLEAAAAKEWNTVQGWDLIDDTVQVRGGRGYETEQSLANRGEPPVGVERAMRDSRINLIFEGSSEIMHLFMAREAVDKHLEIAGDLVDPEARITDKLGALPGILWFYARWYPRQWLGWGRWPRYRRYGSLGKHLRFADRTCRRLARVVFHGMLAYRAKLEHKQAFLFRAVDIAIETLVLTTCVVRADKLRRLGSARADTACELANLVARRCRRRIDSLLGAMWKNDDATRYAAGRKLLKGDYRWLETGTIEVPFDEDDLAPEAVGSPVDDHPGATDEDEWEARRPAEVRQHA